MHLCFSFSLWRQMAPQQSAKFRTAFFGQFRVSLWKDRDNNYASIWALFSTSVYGTRCTLLRTKHFADPSVDGATRFENCARNFAKRKQSDAEFAKNTAHVTDILLT